MKKTTAEQQSFLDSLYWDTRRRDQGQIVEVSYPQIPGAAEGSEGPAEGLSLAFDRSDWSWEITDAKLGTILSGKGKPAPTVSQAMVRRAAMKAHA